MRFLCLHGYATSSDALRYQTENLISHLPSGWEFEYLEGTEQASTIILRSLDQLVPPTLCWYNLPVRAKLEELYESVLRFTDDHGPFDAILGFSQGGLVAASLLLHDKTRQGGPQLPFKMAVLLSTFPPHNITSPTVHWDLTPQGKLEATVEGIAGEETEDWCTDARTAFDYNILRGNLDKVTFPVDLVMKYDANHDAARINVPVVHTRGRREGHEDMYERFLELCDPAMVFKCEHDGGHEIPRGDDEVVQLAELIIQASLTAY